MNQEPDNRSHRSESKFRLTQLAPLLGVVVLALAVMTQNRSPVGSRPQAKERAAASSDTRDSLISTYSSAKNFLINGDFELAGDRRWVDNWVAEGEALKVPDRSSTYAKYGTYSLRLLDATRKSQAEVFQDVRSPADLTGKTFTFYSWIRLPAGAKQQRIVVRIEAGGQAYTYQPTVNDHWELYSFSDRLSRPASGQTDANQSAIIDSVRLVFNLSPPGVWSEKGEVFFDGAKLAFTNQR